MRIAISIFVAALFLAAPVAQAQTDAMSPEGYWKTIDDDGKTPKSVVYLWLHEGKVHGKIIKLFRKAGEDMDPVCDKCEGANKNKRTIGLKILSGLEKDDEEWSGGKILDPNNGKFYKCYIEVQDGGKKLKVRGYIGFALLGRTQYWHRTTKPTDEVEVIK